MAKANANASTAWKKIERKYKVNCLADYIVKTLYSSLTEEEKIAAANLVKDQHESGWIDPSTEEWCRENGINID